MNKEDLIKIWTKFKSDFKVKFDHTGSFGHNQYISDFEFGRFLNEADKVIYEIIVKSKEESVNQEEAKKQ